MGLREVLMLPLSGECFMRLLAFLLLLVFLFAVPTLAQAPILPFAYVTMGSTGQDLHLMNASTGENLYDFATARDDCPIDLSANGRWFAYWSNEDGFAHNYMLDIETGEIESLANGLLRKVVWSAGYNYVAYLYQDFVGYVGNVNTVYLYQMENGEELLVDEMQATIFVEQYAIQFLGSRLLYASINSTRGIVEFKTWEGGYLDTEYFEDEAFKVGNQIGSQIAFSPNGQYLSIYNFHEGGISLLNLETGDVHVTNPKQESYQYSFQWLPNEAATFLYLYKTEDLVIPEMYHARLASESQPLSMGDYSFFLSPDGTQLVYRFFSDDDDNSVNLRLLNLQSHELTEIAETYRWSSDVRWLSETQFVYVHREPLNEGFREIFLYDVETGENRQLTDSPNVQESFECFLG
jgi:WD40 repeat protein